MEVYCCGGKLEDAVQLFSSPLLLRDNITIDMFKRWSTSKYVGQRVYFKIHSYLHEINFSYKEGVSINTEWKNADYVTILDVNPLRHLTY
jgi:hypothetical protein